MSARPRRTTESVDRDALELRRRVDLTLLGRVVLVTLLLGSAILVNINEVESFGDPSYQALTVLIIATYAASVAWGLMLRAGFGMAPIIYGQLVVDALVVSGAVLLTGGVQSLFIFLFFVTIFSGANLLRLRGALLAGALAVVCLSLIAWLQFGALAPLPEGALTLGDIGLRLPTYALFIYGLAFATVSLLSGWLAERLRRADEALLARESDVEALRHLNDRVVRSVRTGLITLDGRSRVTSVNTAASTILGLQGTKLLGRSLDEVFAPLANAAADGLSLPLQDLEWERPDGDLRHITLRFTPLLGPEAEPEGSLIAIDDVTELRALEQRLRRQERLAALGQLGASLAHEIRNPLGAISGSVELLMAQRNDPGRRERLGAIVQREVQRLNTLLQDFLDYARPREPSRREVDLAALVRDTVEFFRDGRDETPEITLSLPEGRFPAHADPDQVRQVLWNLLLNANHFGAGAPITVELARLDPQDWPRIRPVPAGTQWYAISVRDRGPGLTDEAGERLFEPFFTTRPQGTGLGLATAHQIVANHGGELATCPVEGEGACFRILLPSRPPEEQNRNRQGPAVDALRSGMYRASHQDRGGPHAAALLRVESEE